jgi:dTDP-4-dehydrorhamnose reductase
MKILLFGKNGQVGWELQRALAPLGEVVALDRAGQANLCGDLTQLELLAQTVRTVKPDVVVNAAAYTAVDKAQSEPELAHLINAHAVRVLAQETKALNAWLIHYSTDYVFDGTSNRPYTEEDTPNPQSVYGQSKLAGEQAITATGGKHIILRTSWVYGVHGNNFAKTMLRLAMERDSLRVVADQHGTPTGAPLIADVTAHVVQQIFQAHLPHLPVSGIYNLAAQGITTWHAYAQQVLEIAQRSGMCLKINPQDIEAIKTEQYSMPAKRPANSALNMQKIAKVFGLSLPQWQHGVQRAIEKMLAADFINKS